MQLLYVDTGSDLLWLQCHPCRNCYPQSLPILDPSKSYTYRNESCNTSTLSLTFDAKTECCGYSTKYMDCTGSISTLAKEKLTFNTIYSESSSASLPNVVFGCGHYNYGKLLQGTGVLGYEMENSRWLIGSAQNSHTASAFRRSFLPS